MDWFTFITNLIFLLEFIASIIVAIKVLTYIGNNRIYSRDVLMLTPCILLNILSLAVVYGASTMAVVREVIIIESVISFFIVSNINSKSIKWLSNIFNSISTSFLAISLVYDNIIFYQVNIIVLICINFLYILINKDSKVSTVFDILSNLCSLFIIMSCYFIRTRAINSRTILIVGTLIFNLIIISHISYRLSVLKNIFKKKIKTDCDNKESCKTKRTSKNNFSPDGDMCVAAEKIGLLSKSMVFKYTYED